MIRTNINVGKVSGESGERLCYFCNEGRCALCSGTDKTVVAGKIVEVPCMHDCRQEQRKSVQRAASDARGWRRSRA
jgi:hypothetical protein